MSADALLTIVANAVAIAAVYCRSAVTLLTGAWPIADGAVPISADAPPMSAKAALITAGVGRLLGVGGEGGPRTDTEAVVLPAALLPRMTPVTA